MVIIIHGKYNVRFSVIRFVAFDINVQQISIRINENRKCYDVNVCVLQIRTHVLTYVLV
jgi:hypothetical protein